MGKLMTKCLFKDTIRPTFVRRPGRDVDPVAAGRRQHGLRDAVVAEAADGIGRPLELRLRHDGARAAEQRAVLVLQKCFLQSIAVHVHAVRRVDLPEEQRR